MGRAHHSRQAPVEMGQVLQGNRLGDQSAGSGTAGQRVVVDIREVEIGLVGESFAAGADADAVAVIALQSYCPGGTVGPAAHGPCQQLLS